MRDADEFVKQAGAAVEAGDSLVARGYLRRAARIAPERLDIWVALCQVTDRTEDRVKCLERIVALDPANAEARAELDHLRSDDSLETDPVQGVPPDALSDQEPQRTGPTSDTDSAAPSAEPPGMRLGINDEMREQWEHAVLAGEPLVCIDHPHRETVLRCNNCGAPVCTDCVLRTPVGLRCKECIKAQQATFYNALWRDYPLAALVALALSVPAAIVTSLIGWWFALIVSPFAGGLIGGAVHWAIGRRRGQYIWVIVAVCIVLGAFVAWVTRPYAVLPIGIYAATATGAAVGVLRMGKRR